MSRPRTGAASAIRLIAERELRVRSRARAFRVFTIVQIVGVVAIVVVAGLTGGSSKTVYHVAAQGPHPELDAAARAAPAYGARLDIRTETAAAARAALAKNDLDAAVVNGTLLTSEKSPDVLIALIQTAHTQMAVRAALAAAHADPDTTRAVLTPAPLPQQKVAATHRASDSARALAFIGAVLLYMALIGAGATVAGGVVEEKTSRVVEIILSTTTASRLLAGKVLGVGLLSLGQLLLIILAGLLAAVPTGVVALPHATLGVAGLLLLWFVLGYALFACAFAAVGALVSRQEDLASAQLPLMLLLGIGYVISLGISDPSSPLAVALTFVPPLAPTVVPARAALGDLPLWQLALSVALSIAFTAGLVRLAARLYSDGVLRTGAPIRLVKALRELRRPQPTH